MLIIDKDDGCGTIACSGISWVGELYTFLSKSLHGTTKSWVVADDLPLKWLFSPCCASSCSESEESISLRWMDDGENAEPLASSSSMRSESEVVTLLNERLPIGFNFLIRSSNFIVRLHTQTRHSLTTYLYVCTSSDFTIFGRVKGTRRKDKGKGWQFVCTTSNTDGQTWAVSCKMWCYHHVIWCGWNTIFILMIKSTEDARITLYWKIVILNIITWHFTAIIYLAESWKVLKLDPA